MQSILRTLRTRSGQQRIIDIASVIVLTVGAVIILIPFFWMISTALKQNGDVFLVPPQWIPTNPKWENFSIAFAQLKLDVYAFNTFFIVTTVMAGTLLSASFAAYGFARLQAPGRDTIFMLLLATVCGIRIRTLAGPGPRYDFYVVAGHPDAPRRSHTGTDLLDVQHCWVDQHLFAVDRPGVLRERVFRLSDAPILHHHPA